MKLIIQSKKYSYLLFIVDSCNAYWQMFGMDHISALDRLGNTVSEHHHRHKKSNCQFAEVLKGDNTGKYSNGTVKYDEQNSIPVVK